MYLQESTGDEAELHTGNLFEALEGECYILSSCDKQSRAFLQIPDQVRAAPQKPIAVKFFEETWKVHTRTRTHTRAHTHTHTHTYIHCHMHML